MYRKRIADILLQRKLQSSGAVLIQGPKWCGKTTTAEQVAQSTIYINDPSAADNYRLLAETNISLLLRGATPRLIDEWQLFPRLWDAIRFDVDHNHPHQGRFILTGSAVPPQANATLHSGVGRFAWLTMRPMSLWESGDSNGMVSLTALFEGENIGAEATATDIERLCFLICRGGWPEAVDMEATSALELPFNYLDAVVSSDISRVDGVQRNATFARRLLRSYARHQGTSVSINELYADIQGNAEATLSARSLETYLKALRQIFVVEDMEAWNPNLRSKTAIRATNTRYFVDPSIAVAALGVGPRDLLADLRTLGLLFETMAIRDLRIYTDALRGNVFHYRDKNGLECDAVIHLRNGRYALCEIKLGGETLIDEGARSLLQLERKIDTTRMSAPAFKMVLTGLGSYAYRRPDGVLVVPISSLKD